MAWSETGAFKKAWEAPAADPRDADRRYLIFVQLDAGHRAGDLLLDVREPMLSAVFTFGLYVAGHFSADLKHFDVVVGDSPVRYVTTALYYLLPNMATFDVKNAVVHAQPVPSGYVGDHNALRRSPTRGARRCGRVDLLAAGLQMTAGLPARTARGTAS